MTIQNSKPLNIRVAVRRCKNFAFCVLRFAFQQRKDFGFTLLEMMVATGIFTALVVASIGIIINASNAQIKAANVQGLQDNIRFALELITKEMRTGTGYRLSSLCGSGPGEEISFLTALGEARTYYLNGGKLMRLAGSGDCSNARPLTADEIRVEGLRFTLRGEALGPIDGQPAITITLKMSATSAKIHLESTMNLQTTVVQRLRDL